MNKKQSSLVFGFGHSGKSSGPGPQGWATIESHPLEEGRAAETVVRRRSGSGNTALRPWRPRFGNSVDPKAISKRRVVPVLFFQEFKPFREKFLVFQLGPII